MYTTIGSEVSSNDLEEKSDDVENTMLGVITFLSQYKFRLRDIYRTLELKSSNF